MPRPSSVAARLNRRLKRAGLAAIDVAIRPLLAPFRLPRDPKPADTGTASDEEITAFNRAAEDYYARHASAAHVTNKPFSEPETFAKRLMDVGVIVDGLRLQPGDVVLELGAGGCWLSHFLNRLGCKTIAVDVSASALAMGRRRFDEDPHTNWALSPEFHTYDGRTIPVAGGVADAAILYDTFHHLPNPRDVLRELRRILKPHGVVGLSEPGRGHAKSAGSALETGTTGVLERELVLEDIAAAAVAAGFAAARVVIAPRSPILEIDALSLRDFMGGQEFAQYWRGLCAALDGHHYLLLHAGDPTPTTRRPRRLTSALSADVVRLSQTNAAAPLSLDVTVRNLGDTTWLHAEGPGWTRLGAHLYRADDTMTLVDFDWVRVSLPRDIAPGDELTVPISLPVIAPGRYTVMFDLVVEGLTWFAERESPPLVITLTADA